MDTFSVVYASLVCINLIYVLLFYKLERRELEKREQKILFKSNRIYFDLILMAGFIPVCSLLIFIIFFLGLIELFYEIPQIGDAFLTDCLYFGGSVICYIGTFFGINYIIFKRDYDGLYFSKNGILHIKYNFKLQVKESDLIEVEELEIIKILSLSKYSALQFLFKNDFALTQFYNGYYLNLKKFKAYCLEQKIQLEELSVTKEQLKELERSAKNEYLD
jgi:hypothetical protein